MNLLSTLGKNVTTNKGKMVLVEDTYPKERLCGKTASGEFVVMTADFIEVDMTEENGKWAFKPTPPIPAYLMDEPKVVPKSAVLDQPVTLESFIIMLQKHDWYYNYSDDAAVWRDGKNGEEEINRIIRKYGTQYEQAYNQYKPETFTAWK